MSNTAQKTIVSAMLLGSLATGCQERPKPQLATTEPVTHVPVSTKKLSHEALENFRLNKVALIDSNGRAVNLDTVSKWVGNHYSTTSFMFNACGTTCPRVTYDLSQLSKQDTSVRHIVISANTWGDFQHNSLRNYLASNGLDEKNTMVLFPIDAKGKTQFDQLRGGEAAAAHIEQGLGMLTGGLDHKEHNARVTVYNPSGKEIGFANINRESVTDVIGKAIKTDRETGTRQR